MPYKFLTPQGIIEPELAKIFKTPQIEDILKILYLITPKLTLRCQSSFNKLLINTPANYLNKPYFFQHSRTQENLELAVFKNRADSEVYGFGTPEKVLPLLTLQCHKEEILRLSRLWLREGLCPYLIGVVEPDGFVADLYPAHYQDKLGFVGLVGIP